ncbi:MAG: tRNA (uridine(54)-C5)-methyltransferase TrmA [Pseudomonadales bacterium]
MHPSQATFQPTAEEYQDQLSSKVERLSEILKPFTAGIDSVHQSPGTGYRMRAEFRVWHNDDDLNYVMFPKGEPKSPFIIDRYLPGSSTMQRHMPILLKVLRQNNELRNRLFQVDFLTTQTGECLLSLLYHRKLEHEWESQARELETLLNVSVIGRSRKQKIVCSKDSVKERFHVADRELYYKQYENSFTQPNATINEQMLGWAQQHTVNSNHDLLELYCGNGNFSIALASNFRKVLATEVDKFGIRAALFNAEQNAVENLELVRMSAEDVSSALSAVREFRRFAHIDLHSYAFGTVLVDPPRAGLDDTALKFIQSFDKIIYVSCNPDSLRENLQSLTSTHKLVRSALFDQFPFTEHIETGVILQRR